MNYHLQNGCNKITSFTAKNEIINNLLEYRLNTELFQRAVITIWIIKNLAKIHIPILSH